MPTWQPSIQFCNGANSITYQMCNNWANNDPNDCKNNAPAGTIGWQSCDLLSSPNGTQPGNGATLCSPATTSITDFPCANSFNCYAITQNSYSNTCDSTSYNPTRSICNGANQTQFQQCVNWANNDPNSCNNSNVRPANVVAWQTCAQGSSPGGAEPGNGAIVCGAPSSTFNCVNSLNCFAITAQTPNAGVCDTTTYSQVYQACDGNDLIQYESCDNWTNNDPNSCYSSSKKPNNVVDWKKCALGSSPGGLVPNKGASACPLPATTTFGCVNGQECFAVISRSTNDATCVSQNPLNILNSLNPFSWLSGLTSWFYVAGIICSVLLALSIICCLFMVFRNNGSSSAASLTAAASLPIAATAFPSTSSFTSFTPEPTALPEFGDTSPLSNPSSSLSSSLSNPSSPLSNPSSSLSSSLSSPLSNPSSSLSNPSSPLSNPFSTTSFGDIGMSP